MAWNMIKHRSQNAKRWMITLSQRNLNQILWLSPSLFLFSSSFSSSFLSFPATDQYIDKKDVTTQSTNTYDPFLSKFQISFFLFITNFEAIVPGSCRTPLWYTQNKPKIISNAKEQAPSLVNPCPRISDLYLVREYRSHASLPLSV